MLTVEQIVKERNKSTKSAHHLTPQNNMTRGVYKRTEENNKINSISHTGLKYPNRKRPPPLTESHRKNISNGMKGKNTCKDGIRPPMLGRHHSEETKKKISEGQRGEKSVHWKGGKSFEPYSVDWTKTLKRSIRERDRYICFMCKKEPASDIHHIDYDKLNCNPDNLITLCDKCHAKTNHNRDYWINYFKENI